MQQTDAELRDNQKIAILRKNLKDADIDMLTETYEMLLKKRKFFETDTGAAYIESLKAEIEKRNNLSKMDKKNEKIIAMIMSIIAVICIIGAVYYGYKIIHEQYIYKESQEEIDDLKCMLDLSGQEEMKEHALLDIGPNKSILKKYRKVYEENNDFIGWITIPGTQLDYPVMQKDDNDYYLKHGFDKGDSEIGIPFMDMRNDWEMPDDNLIIYGHNLKNGNMFGSLKNYLDKEYYKQHPVIHFDTLYEKAKYEIVYVGLSRAANKNEDVFRYYEFINAENEDDFKVTMKEFKKLESYSIGKKVQWGDKLITLSTCSKHVENGRLIVVARKIVAENSVPAKDNNESGKNADKSNNKDTDKNTATDNKSDSSSKGNKKKPLDINVNIRR